MHRYAKIFNAKQYHPHERKFGITENGYWCSCENEVYELRKNDDNRIFFQLLEIPVKDLIRLVKQGLSKRDLPEAIILTFPFDNILIPVLDSSWSDLAIEWLKQGYPSNDEIDYMLSGRNTQSADWLKKQKERLSDFLEI